MKNVVPFRSSATFEKFGVDWTKDASTEHERYLRDAFLTYERSCGPNGLVSLVLLAIVSRRQGTVAQDLQDAADFAEIILSARRGGKAGRVARLVAKPRAKTVPRAWGRCDVRRTGCEKRLHRAVRVFRSD